MESDRTDQRDSSRRHFLTLAMAGAAAGLAAKTAVDLDDSVPVSAQSKLSPDAALEELMAGNRRFAAGRSTAYKGGFAGLRQQTLNKQEPFAAVLSCADSRVPVELVFDQTIGSIFVTRLAGNIATPEVIASLEYGVAVLGTKALLVIGHAKCGAVKAAIEGKAVPGQISALFAHIRPAIDQAGSDAEAATRANAVIQAKLLREASPVIADAAKEGKLKVAAAYYDIGSGHVTIL